MRTTLSKTLTTTLVALNIVTSCKQNKKETTPVKNIRNTQISNTNYGDVVDNRTRGIDYCESSNLIEILKNGKTAVSKLKTDRNKVVEWDINTGKVLREINYPVGYDKISSNGRFLLRQINSKKFQLVELKKNSNAFQQTIELNSSNVPKLKFSLDSKYLIINYKPLSIKREVQIVLYDLEEKKYVKSFKQKDLTFIQETMDSKFLIIGTDDGVEQKILKVEIESLEQVLEVELPNYTSFLKMEVAKNHILVKTRKEFLLFDIQSGERKVMANYQYFFGLGNQKEMAIFADNWLEFKIVELLTNTEINIEKRPEGLDLSSCKLNDETMMMSCKDPRDPRKVLKWNLVNHSKKTICY